MRLSELQTGQECVVVKILGHGAFRKRVIEMGFVRGRVVKVLLHAPLRDPIKYEVMGYDISLRRSEADLIEVVPLEAAGEALPSQAHAVEESSGREDSPRSAAAQGRVINVALVGNPNCGKTSLFNMASGAKEHVGNYSGVTVDVKEGTVHYKGYTLRVADLPGTYSLSAYSPEELYVRRYLRDANPDVIVNVVDSSNLERNLYLTTELIDMDRSMVIALNMYDELRASGTQLDYGTLGHMIGVPMVPVVARDGEGVDDLLDAIINVYEGCHEHVRHVHVNLGRDIEGAVRTLVDILKGDRGLPAVFSPRYLAIKFLEGDGEVDEMLRPMPYYERLKGERDRLSADLRELSQENVSDTVAAEKYGFIAGALAETMVKGEGDKSSPTSVIDSVVTNKVLGFPLFLLIMLFIFWATFALGSYPMEWIESGVAALSGLVGRWMPDGILKDLVADGIIGGVGGVIVFLPNILILYYCISFMEDSGYMARAAFIMDKLMHRIGLHGKSFIPLVMGFGCNVPAIMATRSIESRSSRIITIMINPFMSCSARLPLYVLLIGTFFPAHAAWVFMGLYLCGIAAAVVTAKLLRRFVFSKDETPFVMELPPYRVPTLRASLRHTWAKGVEYVKKMGGIILFASIVVWALNYFPRHEETGRAAAASERIDMNSDSFLAMAGKAVNPVMAPLGFTWRATVAAMAGVPAKEIVVSTLGVLYTGDEATDDSKLGARLEAPGPSGKPDFTPATALSFLIFIVLYCPCLATVAAIVRETGNWRWGALSVVYNTALAWCAAWAAYRCMLLLG